MKAIFTGKQQSQIRKVLDQIMKCGTAHIMLCDATPKGETENGLQWWLVTAQLPYPLQNADGSKYTDDKIYEISVGLFTDRRRHVLTALDLSQHERAIRRKP